MTLARAIAQGCRLTSLCLLLTPLLAMTARATAEPEIRVLLDDAGKSQAVAGVLEWGNELGDKGRTDSAVTVSLAGSQATMQLGDRRLAGSRLVACPLAGHVRYNARSYRGRLEFVAGRSGGVAVLNVLPLEEYLLGVLPAEMPSTWPAAALRAQAVAARTYAVARMAERRDATYDVLATTSDQAYDGVVAETSQAEQAVHDTRGQILTFAGEPIIAYFCSDAGGYTKGGGAPYLQPVACPSPQSPHSQWTFELTNAELAELAAASGSEVGAVFEVVARHDPVSGHLQSILLQGDQGSCTLDGTSLRRYIGRNVMKSTRVRFTPKGSAETSIRTPNAPSSETLSQHQPVRDYDTVSMEGYYRPWVATSERETGLKLRLMYAYNGTDLLKCNRPVHVFSGILESTSSRASAPGAPATITAISGDGPLSGLVVHGSGYGHGLGLSQWGARQLAEEGKSYRDILLHFYSGVELVAWSGVLPEPTESTAGQFYQPYRRGD